VPNRRAKIVGDEVLASAYSHELKDYGFPVKGVKNYAAAYATGLLLARRLLAKLKMDDKYQGNTNVDGNDFHVEEIEDGPRPFFALLDVGLNRTTTGAKIFAAMKGACDGGLEIPHSEKRFVGYDKESKSLNAETLRKHIFGGNVADYMKKMQEEDADKYKRYFAGYLNAGLTADKIEDTWKKVHANIRKNPAHKKKEGKKAEQKSFRPARKNLKERKNRVKQILASMAKQE